MFDASLAALTLTAAFLFAPAAQPDASEAQPASHHDIVEVASSAGSFETLVKAIQAAGLVETLKGEGPFTVFAPTDEAFARIPEEDLSALLADREKLTAVLTYHVVPGRVASDQVASLSSAETVNGQKVRIRVQDGAVMIDDATVVTADIAADNGVIHVIDRVILPAAQ